MNSIVEQLISQPDATVVFAQQSVNRAIETELGERAAVLQSGLNPRVTQSNRQQVIDWLSDHNFPALPVAPQQDAYKYHNSDLAPFPIRPFGQRFEGNFKAILCSNISIVSDGAE